MSGSNFDFDSNKHQLLKSDLFGSVSKEYSAEHGWLTYRNTDKAVWWCRGIARYLAKREAKALNALPKQIAKPTEKKYFSDSLKLLRFLHQNNVAHNDLSKETNWLVTPNDQPALVDFQLARHFKTRTAWFRNSAREDIRYLLKHKRGFCPNSMTEREWKIVNTPSLPSRIWKQTGKRVYLFITRRIFNWQDREGAYDRTGKNGTQVKRTDNKE